MMYKISIIFVLIHLCWCNHHHGQWSDEWTRLTDDDRLVCKGEGDDQQQQLDWFTLYKLPKMNKWELQMDHDDFDIAEAVGADFVSNLTEGTAYMYMTSQSQRWQRSDLSLNDSRSLPGQTMQQLYDNVVNQSTIGYVLYNDQADKVTLIKGHTKGVLLFNKKSVVWIVHSIPHYPPTASDGKYFIRPPQCFFGQSMLCMSFSLDQIETIGRQLLYTYPQVYDSYLPDELKSLDVLQPIVRVVGGEHVEEEPWFSVARLRTLNGESLLSFAKYTDFEDDLYSGLVAPLLKSDLLCETWNNGPGTLPPNCSAQYHVMNIQEVEALNQLKFSVHHDHSKWTVTSSSSSVDNQVRIACLGDINRQEDQFKRAGGTVCFESNPVVWEQFNGLVSDVEKCRRKKRVNRRN